jgi:hypothetical protein
MRIMQALLTRIEYLGFPASAKRGYHLQTTEAVIFDEAISFGISEKSRQIDHVLTDSEMKDIARYGRHFDTPKWDYEPTGLLSLRIDTWAFKGIRKNWNDGKHQWFLQVRSVQASPARPRSFCPIPMLLR